MPKDVSSKIRLALLYGGRSGEHDVSIASATSVMQAIDGEKYEVLPVYLTPEGRWLPGVEPGRLKGGLRPDAISAALLSSDPQRPGLMPLSEAEVKGSEVQAVDVVFPLLHGTYGEDGTVQGLLELANVPYVGSGVLGSAAGMDKSVMKTLFAAAGLPVVPHLLVRRRDWERQPTIVQDRILEHLRLPVFVKPANLGSSVGISKVRDVATLPDALNLACQYDRRVLVEQGLECREFECSVLGNEEPKASVIGEIIPTREFYDYLAKYNDESSELQIPANIAPGLADDLRGMAVTAFQAVDAAGLARVDFFLETRSGKPYVNEINTLPGFTTISMYPKLWEAGGISYPRLIDELVCLAVERHRDRQRSLTVYAALPDQEGS
jgi:D-alanine-D-alanine ligase